MSDSETKWNCIRDNFIRNHTKQGSPQGKAMDPLRREILDGINAMLPSVTDAEKKGKWFKIMMQAKDLAEQKLKAE